MQRDCDGAFVFYFSGILYVIIFTAQLRNLSLMTQLENVQYEMEVNIIKTLLLLKFKRG
jgi:hypothetical protein